MKNVYRVFFALWFLIGWMIHVYLGIWSPETYQGFNSTVIFSPSTASVSTGNSVPHSTAKHDASRIRLEK